MRIGLDIDDVLFPWSDHAHAASVAAGITNGREITQWRMHLDYGCTADEWWDVINAAYEAGMLDRRPYDDVEETLIGLRGAGHTIHLVTARGFEGPLAELVRRTTAAWVLILPHDSLTFAKDKTTVRADVFLDDSIANVEALRAHGVDAYLRDQPHNRSDESLPRVADLTAFARIIHSLDGAA